MGNRRDEGLSEEFQFVEAYKEKSKDKISPIIFLLQHANIVLQVYKGR